MLDLFVKSARTFLDGWFESEAVKAAFGFDAVVGNYASPDTPGSAYVLLHHVFGEVNGRKGAWGHAVGGMGAITQAMAKIVQGMGVQISLEAPVAQVIVAGGRALGARLESGEEVMGDAVIGNVGPKLLYERMIAPSDLSADFLRRIRSFKAGSGTFRMNVALSRVAELQLPAGARRAPAVGHHHRPDARLHGPGLPRCQAVRHVEGADRRDADPVDRRRLARTSRSPCRQPVLPAVRAGAARRAQLGRRARGGRRSHHRHGRGLCTRLQGVRGGAPDPVAARSRAQVRAGRRRHHARQHVARSAVVGAAGAGPWRVSRAAEGALHVRCGHASRRRRHRRAGAQCRAPDPRRPLPARPACCAGSPSRRRRTPYPCRARAGCR